jgi:hypothetical protein
MADELEVTADTNPVAFDAELGTEGPDAKEIAPVSLAPFGQR